MLIGTASTLALIYLSPTIQVDILKHETAWFPLRNPALVTMPLSFLTAIVVSLLTPNAAELAGYERVERVMHTGV
jgi:cation/acetate symporter